MFPKILLLLLFPLLASGGPKPFRCNSPEEVREMRIKQVIPTANYTYLLTENQLFFFNPPFCFLNAKNQVICAIDAGEAFEVENSKFKSRTGKQKGLFFRILRVSFVSASLITYKILSLGRLL